MKESIELLIVNYRFEKQEKLRGQTVDIITRGLQMMRKYIDFFISIYGNLIQKDQNREDLKMSERFQNIDWYCDRCNSYLNSQEGFDDHHYVWKCTNCGHKNSISLDDIYESQEEFEKYRR